MNETARLKKYQDDSPAKFVSRPAVRAIVWEKTGGRCWYCGRAMNPWVEFCVDHLVPRCKGGTESLENLVPCCRHCNLSKGGKDLEDFRSYCAEAPDFIFYFEEDV